MDIDSTFESDAQFAHACEPRVSALHDPAMAPQPVVALDPLARDAWRDAPLLEVMVATVDVVGLVSVQLAWPTSWPPWLAGDRRQGIDQFLQDHRVVPVGSGSRRTPRERHCGRRSDAACCRVCRDRSGSARCTRPPGGRPHWPRPGWLGSGPACRLAAIRPAGPDAGDARRRRPASRATGANRSCRCRSPFQGKVFPWDAGTQDIDDAVEGLLIADARPPSFGEGLTGGISGSMRFHSAAGISLRRAMPPILPPTNLRSTRFC